MKFKSMDGDKILICFEAGDDFLFTAADMKGMSSNDLNVVISFDFFNTIICAWLNNLANGVKIAKKQGVLK